MKKKIMLILVVIIMSIFGGCFSFINRQSNQSQLNQRYRSDKDAVVATEKQVVDALNLKNPQMLKDVFSKDATEHAYDLDIGIDYLFSLLDGEILEVYDSNFSASGYFDSGKKMSVVSAWCYLKTAKSTYKLSYILYSINESAPEKEGVYRLNLYRINDGDLKGYNRYRLAGIDYQEREYAHQLVNSVVQCIQESDSKALQSLFDERALVSVLDFDLGAQYAFGIMSDAKIIGNLDSWIIREEMDGCNIYQAFITVETTNGDFMLMLEYSVDHDATNIAAIRKLMIKQVDDALSSVGKIDVIPDRYGVYYPGWDE